MRLQGKYRLSANICQQYHISAANNNLIITDPVIPCYVILRIELSNGEYTRLYDTCYDSIEQAQQALRDIRKVLSQQNYNHIVWESAVSVVARNRLQVSYRYKIQRIVAEQLERI